VLNGANEVCVEEFLAGRLPFTGIVTTVSSVVDKHLEDGWLSGESLTVADVLAADRWARDEVTRLVRAQ
jgi:1-deoxy-D-xylulose-5-phosphate reductoisomerase